MLGGVWGRSRWGGGGMGGVFRKERRGWGRGFGEGDE